MSAQTPQITPEIQAKIDTLKELFLDWTTDDLMELVQEHGDIEVVIDKIKSGAVIRKNTAKKEMEKERDKNLVITSEPSLPVQKPEVTAKSGTSLSSQQQQQQHQLHYQTGLYRNQPFPGEGGHSYSMYDTARNQSQQQVPHHVSYRQFANPQFQQNQFPGMQDQRFPSVNGNGSDQNQDYIRNQNKGNNKNKNSEDTDTVRQYHGMISAAYPTFDPSSQSSITSEQQQQQQQEQYMQYYQQRYSDPFALSQQGFGTITSGSLASQGFAGYNLPNSGYHFSQNLRARGNTLEDNQQPQSQFQQQQQQQGISSAGQSQSTNGTNERANSGHSSYSFNMSSHSSRGFY